jgi:squalene/oxidosqualene cyclase-like protein
VIGASEATDRRQIDEKLSAGVRRLASLQDARGAWEGEMVWNTMLLAQVILVHRIVEPGGGPPFDAATRARQVRYFARWQTPEGGWGMHPESGPYVFFTVLAYAALRALGLAPSEPMLVRARRWLASVPGGVLSVPTWGKLWLAVLGVAPYEGVNPIPPEMFLLPRSWPVHPSRFYCHTRYAYVALAYLYGRRFVADLGPLAGELRHELYGAAPIEARDFVRARHSLAATDVYVAPSAGLRLAYDVARVVERASPLRERALRYCLERVEFELRASRHHGLSPVNGLLACLVLYASDARHPDLPAALRGMEAWRWEDDEQGIRYVGARSTSWDTAFAVQTLAECPASPAGGAAVQRGVAFLASVQMGDELTGAEGEAREPILGGWCFSEGSHRWPVSDCTAEAIIALLGAGGRIDEDAIERGVDFILRRQNRDGGFGTYEPRRAPGFLETLNPSEMYGSCMTELSYIECTASCVAALARVRARIPRLAARVEAAVARAVAMLRAAQRPDGSYLGFWGVCFTYATFLVMEALHAAGAGPGDPTLVRAAAFLCARQRPDGAWAEHWTAVTTSHWVDHPAPQPVMTSWALLGLLRARPPSDAAVRRGAAWLAGAQRTDGSWEEGNVAGVFFGSALLDYRYYREYFPLWALARYRAACARV